MQYSLSLPRWSFWTHPNVSWIESFANKRLGPDVIMWGEESDSVPAWFAWTSRHLDDLSDPQELRDRVTSLKALFDGAMYLAMGSTYGPFELIQPTAENEKDRHILSGFPDEADVTVEPFSACHLRAKHGLSDEYLDDPLTRSLFLARYDDVTRAILKYAGVQGFTYQSLYAFRDWMKEDWDEDKVAQEAGWTKRRLNDFTNTANNPAYLGPFCRHGGTKAPAPKRPMQFSEAEKGMRRAVNQFLLYRANLCDLRTKWKALK